SDRRDFYKLTVEEQTEIVAKLTGLTANADFYLQPQKGQVIDKSKNGGKQDEEISATLEPGTYYFRVQPRNNRIKNAGYNLDLEVVESADPGNSKGKAFDIGTLTEDFNIEESVGKSDRRDFYKLTVEEQTEIVAKLTGLTANADFYLQPQKGQVIDKSKNGGKQDEEISATLEPGTYYFRVQPRNNRIKNAGYNLDLEVVESVDPGNSKGKAFDIGTLTENFNIEESVGKSDRRDFYKFQIDSEQEVKIELTDLEDNADLYLYRSEGKPIDKSKKGGKQDELIDSPLEEGTYYLEVRTRNKKVNTDYTLNFEVEELATKPGSDLERFEFTYYYEGNKDQKNQDFYEGYVYAPKGTYEVGSYFDFNEEDNEASANGKYYISDSSVAEEDAQEGVVYLESYYNVENDQSYTPDYAGDSLALGTEGLESELEIAASEFIESDLERFEFTYYYKGNKDKKNQDFYNGYVYAPTGTYQVGSYFDFNEEDNETDANGKYYISGSSVVSRFNLIPAYRVSESSVVEEPPKEGEVYLESYYNVENDKSYTPYYASGDFASGTEGLGSEQDFIGTEFDSAEDAVALSSQGFFGADNYVADILPKTKAPVYDSGDYQIDALLKGVKWGTKEITYSFYSKNNGGPYYGNEEDVGEVSDKVKQNVRHILEHVYEPLLDVDFVEVPDSSSSYGLIRVMKSSGPDYAYAYYPPLVDGDNTGTAKDVHGDIHLNLKYDGSGGTNNFQGDPGTHGYKALIHELGHAVGLEHPHSGNVQLPEAEDNSKNTVMSYNNYLFKPDTLMPYDIKALQYMYGSLSFSSAKIAFDGGFTVNNGGWPNQNEYPRHVADVNGDGRADIVGFGHNKVAVALGQADGTFGSSKTAFRGFTVGKGGWPHQKEYPRHVADVNGDGRADIVGFGHNEVTVALGKADGTFGSGKTAFRGFAVGKGGWPNQNKYPRHVADVNGDGRADIVGFGHNEVTVALGQADGTFGSSKTAFRGFTVGKGGWPHQNKYPRHVADVNGDGRADIVGFGHNEVTVALGKADGTFGSGKTAFRGFAVGKGGWVSQDKYPRHLADINGDGRADIVGFGQSKVYVALGQADGTFGSYKISYHKGFTVGKGEWVSQDKYPRHLADVNGDGQADIVGFGHNKVFVALA
ncbi:MAG: hypothetical protein F6K40_21760, partial [Okeania sp. SIO3I5]|uniref:FG-GAP-like repeat-containing protein n=1 Tax=Okeania sp. SIO3I5 TaxID=2607805 RepID=UPI0013B94485